MPHDLAPPATCNDCRHHVPLASEPLVGECRGGRPSRPVAYSDLWLMAYPLTACDLPACPDFQPRDRPQAPPVLETKVEPKPEAKKPAPAPRQGGNRR